MRIRKRRPASAAKPVPAPALHASPPRPLPLLLQQQPKGRSRDEEEEAAEEEKRVILVAGVRIQEEDHDRVPAVASLGSAMDDVLKPEPEPQGAVARCSRNDGKRWRCKSAAAPGYLFCDRHIAWSSRQRKPRPKKHRKQQQQHGSGSVLGSAAAELE
nr:unnamed protein product [Digitaria exilis]